MKTGFLWRTILVNSYWGVLMNFLKKTVVKFIVAGLFVWLPLQANAEIYTDADTACKTMAMKITVQNHYFEWLETKKTWRKVRNPRENEEHNILIATGLRRKEIDKKWPTFLDWAILEVIEAKRLDLTPDEMQVWLHQTCVARYS